MPLLKCKASKSKPNKVINYITRKDKAEFVSSINLSDTKPYTRQFRETCEVFGKNKRFHDRKYYHFKLSADPKDNISPESHHKYALELANKLFPNHECVVATHVDTNVVHSHIVINSIDIEKGKKIRISPNDYAKMKDMANTLGLSYDMTPIDYTKPAEIKIDQKEIYVELKGGTSWKKELREVIDFALKHSSNMETFEKYLNHYGVEIVRNSGNTISYKHPYAKKAIRGQRLGDKYSRKEILRELDERQAKTNDRNESVRLSTIAEVSKQSKSGELSSSKSSRQQSNRNEYSIRQVERSGNGSKDSKRDANNRVEVGKRETDFEFEGTDKGINISRTETPDLSEGIGGLSM